MSLPVEDVQIHGRKLTWKQANHPRRRLRARARVRPLLLPEFDLHDQVAREPHDCACYDYCDTHYFRASYLPGFLSYRRSDRQTARRHGPAELRARDACPGTGDAGSPCYDGEPRWATIPGSDSGADTDPGATDPGPGSSAPGYSRVCPPSCCGYHTRCGHRCQCWFLVYRGNCHRKVQL